jgi:hypothetical protein
MAKAKDPLVALRRRVLKLESEVVDLGVVSASQALAFQGLERELRDLRRALRAMKKAGPNGK